MILYLHAAMINSKDAAHYLSDIDDNTFAEIGIALGLAYSTLQSLNPDKFRDEMIEAWLGVKDKVKEKSGTPTWKSLRCLLKKMGLTEAADSISKGIIYLNLMTKYLEVDFTACSW